jgi:hypothetical protein
MNIKKLDERRLFLIKVIKQMSEDHIPTGHYEKELDSLLELINQFKGK